MITILFFAWTIPAFAGMLWISIEFMCDPYDNGFPIARKLFGRLTGR